MNLLYAFDLIGTFVFALSGAVKAVKIKLDLLGIVAFAITVGTGGGVIRDLLLSRHPLSVFSNSSYILTCIVASVCVIIFSPRVITKAHIIDYFDALGLGVFTAIGADKALYSGYGLSAVIICAFFSSVGGGILRDIFSKEVPKVFTSGFYATASILGALLFYFLSHFSLSNNFLLFLTAAFVTLLRILAYTFNWHLPVINEK